MQPQTQVEKPKLAARSLRLRLRLSRSTTAQQQLSSEIPVEALMAAPGRDFLHVDAPGPALARLEAKLLLKQYSYKAELYGMQDRSLETVEAVSQPWYQTLLDMGSIKVWLQAYLLGESLLFWGALPQMRPSGSPPPPPQPTHLRISPHSPTHPPLHSLQPTHPPLAGPCPVPPRASAQVCPPSQSLLPKSCTRACTFWCSLMCTTRSAQLHTSSFF